MNFSKTFCLPAVFAGLATLGCTVSYYQLTDIGSLGGDYSWGQSMNNSGQVVGWSPLSGENNIHAFLYSTGQMTDIGAFPGFESRAYGINDLGHVVGASGGKGFIFKDGVLSDLPLMDGGSAGPATDINNLNQIVGSHQFDTHPGPTAYRYQSGNIEDLGTLW